MRNMIHSDLDKWNAIGKLDSKFETDFLSVNDQISNISDKGRFQNII